MTTATSQFEIVGANPFVLDGPLVSGVSPTTGAGQIFPANTLGDIAAGNAGSEYVYCKLVLGGATTLQPGQAYAIDKQYTATLLTTAASPRGNNVAFLMVNAPTAPVAGTYFGWFQRAGNLGVVATAAAQGNLAETTATGGLSNFPNSPTALSKLITGLYIYATSFTFTANDTNTGPTAGQSLLTNVVLANPNDVTDIVVGAAIAGTGIPASTFVGAVFNVGGAISIQMVQSDMKTPQVATSANTGLTVTVTGTLVANAAWPYIDKTN